MIDMIVTTGDLKEDYDVIGPVYFQVSNKGLFGSTLSRLIKYYSGEIARMRASGKMSPDRADWGFLYGEWSVGQSDFEKAFFVSTEELKKRAKLVGADAIIGMRQDIDLDTNGFAYFYLQMYGTAVKFKEIAQKGLVNKNEEAENISMNNDNVENNNQIESEVDYSIMQNNVRSDSVDRNTAYYAESDSYKNELNKFKTLTELYEYVQKETFPIGAETRIKNMILEIKKRAPQDDDSESLKQSYTVICNYRELCKQVISGTFAFKETNGNVRCPICGERIKNVEEKSCCFTCGFKWKI